MEYIFHETQDGLLCAQHCLNSLLQSDYYTAPDLAKIAMDLDSIERTYMHASTSNEPGNYDDTGYFSIQVIETALKQWNIDLIPFKSGSDLAKLARENPNHMKAYICNFKQHWYTIRRIGKYWFNLNSMLRQPELISDTYLTILLKQLETDGYSIFIVEGQIPTSEADRHLSNVELDTQYILKKQTNIRAKEQSIINEGFDDDELKKAIKMSLVENDKDLDATSSNKSLSNILYNYNICNDENELEQAIKLSLETSQDNQSKNSEIVQDCQESSLKNATSDSLTPNEENNENIRQKRLLYLEKNIKSQNND